jgi:hypoxanthine phosphoribosyltransferase
MFMADLCREVQVPHEVDFMTASSYGSGMSTTRDVKILKDLDEDIRGKEILIVEDIIDSGNTLSKCVRSSACASRNRWPFVRCWINQAAVK